MLLNYEIKVIMSGNEGSLVSLVKVVNVTTIVLLQNKAEELSELSYYVMKLKMYG